MFYRELCFSEMCITCKFVIFTVNTIKLFCTVIYLRWITAKLTKIVSYGIKQNVYQNIKTIFQIKPK